MPDTNPCLLEQNQYDEAVKAEQDALRKSQAARRKLETMRGTINAADYLEATRAINIGTWPKDILGPLDQTHPLFHQRSSASFIKCAKEAYLARQAYHEALDATAKAQGQLTLCKTKAAYRNWLRSKSKTKACGAPCTSRGRKGQLCHHMLTAKRHCSNHGQRPALAYA